MENEDIKTGLQEYGLSQYEANAYLAVLERGTAPATKISEQTDIPKTRIYDVLDDLERKNYVDTFNQDSRLSVRPREPSEVLSDLEQRAEKLKTAAEGINDKWERPDITDYRISIVKRFESVFDQFQETAEDATHRIQIAVSPSQLDALRPALEDAMDRGVFVKLSIVTGLDDHHVVEEMSLEDIATEAKHRTIPAPFTALVDRTHAFFSSKTHPSEQYGIIIDDLTLAYVFDWYFQSALWSSWPLVYDSNEDGIKQSYVDVRECSQDISPIINDGTSIPATVYGFDVQTGNKITLEGRIINIISESDFDDNGELTLTDLASQATIVLEADGREYAIGGRGATLEDIEATRIRLKQPEQWAKEVN